MTDFDHRQLPPLPLSRRSFLLSLAAAGSGVCLGDQPDGEVLVRIGVMSDSHVTSDPATLEPLRREFSYMAARNVDIVLHCGDICDNGLLDELDATMRTWRECFKDGRNAAGGKVVPFFVFGNHDYRKAPPTGSAGQRARLILDDQAAAWRMICGEDFPGEVFSKTVKGFAFVGAHWRHEGDISAWFKEHPAPTDRPVFYVQHPHPRHTCFGDWAPCEAAGKDELMRHPNLFAVSGHSHISAADECGIWQGGFVSMGAGSARCPSHGRRREYENGNPKLPWPEGEVRHMPSASSGDGWQASIIEVRASGLRVIRHEFHHDEPLGADWELPFPFRHDAAQPYRIASAARAPQFPAGATVKVQEREGKRRPDGAVEQVVRVFAPAAVGDGPHARALGYRFTVFEAATGRTVLERQALQDWVTVSEERARKRPCWCAFAKSDLPAGVPLKVRIEPMNAAFRRGRPIESAEFTVSAVKA